MLKPFIYLLVGDILVCQYFSSRITSFNDLSRSQSIADFSLKVILLSSPGNGFRISSSFGINDYGTSLASIFCITHNSKKSFNYLTNCASSLITFIKLMNLISSGAAKHVSRRYRLPVNNLISVTDSCLLCLTISARNMQTRYRFQAHLIRNSIGCGGRNAEKLSK